MPRYVLRRYDKSREVLPECGFSWGLPAAGITRQNLPSRFRQLWVCKTFSDTFAEFSDTFRLYALHLCSQPIESKRNGRLAQRLERPVYTRKVAGSNPALPTTYVHQKSNVAKIVATKLPH